VRVLVVEDEPRMAHALRRGLTADGFTVEVATDGATGLELARHEDFDAVLLDVMLPRLSGYDVVRALRAERNWVPVLMVSAKDGEHDQADGLDCGADDYLTKPFAFAELLARVRSLFRRASRSRSRILTVGGLELDTATHEVRRDGEPVSLTAKEYALLEYLAYNAGRVLTRDQILDHVWPTSYEGASNTVDVFIRYLRRKIDDGRDAKLIQTVFGVGYTLKMPG
jgi:DNA-binding response OmpR family regulator